MSKRPCNRCNGTTSNEEVMVVHIKSTEGTGRPIDSSHSVFEWCPECYYSIMGVIKQNPKKDSPLETLDFPSLFIPINKQPKDGEIKSKP